MVPVETAWLFFAAAVILALVPGPDNIFVLTHSAVHGRVNGLFVVAGLCSGIMLHTLAVSLGVAALFKASAFAFTLLKLVGAGYLLYLAWLAFRAGASRIGEDQSPAKRWRTLYLRGVVMNVTNPKVAIFFLAFLPQYVDPQRGAVMPQMLLLGGLFIAATVVVFGSIAWMAGFLGEWLRRSERVQIWMNRVAGMVFVGLAVSLIVSGRGR